VIEVLELESGDEDDLVVLHAEARMNERLRVEREQFLEQLRVLRIVPFEIADVDPQHHEGRVDTQRGGGHVASTAYEERSGLVVDRRVLPVHLAEVRFYVVDASHGSRVCLRSV